MPDARPGYKLSIGGVLATENTVISHAVGIDIDCRMKLSVDEGIASSLNACGKSAMIRRSNLQKEPKHLACLTLGEENGQKYGNAMKPMGRHAAATYELTHKHLVRTPGARLIRDIEFHHTSTRKELHLVSGKTKPGAHNRASLGAGRVDAQLVKMCPPGERSEN